MSLIFDIKRYAINDGPVSYTHLRAHETGRNLVCRLLLEKKNIEEPTRQAETTNNHFIMRPRESKLVVCL